ncbi:Inositol polyphosphate multikinase [Neolecta irregularis DAH-3]|uniref:Kinase n=1 Tax=Neolecta irregularis (strain DAH-3) TaxID=1198029 RepID=A0A1U7LND6_NEOID|nr:Inositol polyphosphate multikinase [Neolecta irregularis DAH-3]|eukprot:OLL24164.1 Inositol polyphosphate multikinase [Neolecta irregularis DAH-3]
MAGNLQFSMLRSFKDAAAGHEGVLSDEMGGVLAKCCHDSEVSFYESIAEHPDFGRWLPTYLGTLATDGRNIDIRFKQAVVLENITHGFTRPCVLDVKLGSLLTDDETSEQKRLRLEKVARETTSWPLGIRLTGMRVWKEDRNDYQIYPGEYGKSLTTDSIQSGLAEFFASGLSTEHRELVIRRFIEDVSEIQALLNDQELRMFSASILMVYEGDSTTIRAALENERERLKELDKAIDSPRTENGSLGDIEDDNEPTPNKVTECKMIDFAHAKWTPGEGPDQNVLKGVRSLLSLLEAVQRGVNE